MESQQFLPVAETRHAVKIIMDQREDVLFDALFKELGAEPERRTLEVGDFLCSHRLAVERKTREDFESSIIDARLFHQLVNMKSNYPSVVIIVEGEVHAERIKKEATLGAYASIIADFGATIFFTKNKERTAELIFALAKHEQFAKKQPLRVFAKRKTFTISQNQRAVVEMFPMIGPKFAKKLLSHFGSLDSLLTASEKELAEVQGMGEKRAKIIKNILKGEYKEDEDESVLI